ncbi:MAG: ParB N-terminal domain-containing protein [Planctomycetes bacterium]|nr:ParB N-terminal domain-containing protein [Planctomycetota bacterium]
MMDPHAPTEIKSIAQRTFAMIRVDAVDVVTSRGRGQQQLKENVRSIADNGLYKPILVNALDYANTGRYQLICGEGRLMVHQKLKKEEIKAEIVTVSLAKAHIMSLGENMTKCQPQTIEYAYAILEMHEQGASIKDLERVTGFQPHYIRCYISLVKNGEERLIKGVERGLFPLEFAMRVAETPDGAIQHILMDAFDKKFITAQHVDMVRNILMDRSRQGPSLTGGDSKSSLRPGYSAKDLMKDITRLTNEKEKFVSEADYRGTRLISMIDTLRRLAEDKTFLTLIKRHGIEQMPKLQGRYGV